MISMIEKLRVQPLAGLTLMLVFAGLADAQATRTWVSGVGDDVNPCSRTAPCKTFGGAISKTAAGGEISVLDPAGFGAVTITKAITIDGGGGIVAGILASGTNGIIVNAGANDVVTLRNLRINGAGTGLNGIRYLAGKALHLENIDINSFSNNGIDVNMSTTGKLTVDHVVITDVGVGISILDIAPNAVSADIYSTRISHTTTGFSAQSGTFAALRDCTISDASAAGILQSNLGGGSSLVTVVGSTLSSDNIALQSTAGALILASGNSFVLNSAIFSESGGQIYTTGDNINSSNGAVGANHGSIPKI
jgi:hypothetical protein